MDCSVSFVIGDSNDCGLGFTTLNWKLLYNLVPQNKLETKPEKIWFALHFLYILRMFGLLYFIPEEIGINSPDEREVILSEIYRRFHPEEEDLFEMEIQGALQDASEQEKMKIMAVLNALRSPAFQAELGLTSSTGSSSPRDSDPGFHMPSETASLSGSMTGSEGHSHDLGMPPPPPPPTMSAYSSHSLGRSLDVSLNDSFCGDYLYRDWNLFILVHWT